MISKTFNRYVWLLNTLLPRRRLTFGEISQRWEESCLGDGSPLALRTFHMHREAIAELFGVEIKCDTSYRYYISSPEELGKDCTRHWLVSSFSVSNMIDAGRNMKDRILFEKIPAGTEHLQTVIEAMQQGRELEVNYRPFDGPEMTLHINPYAMKVYNQRWYVVGLLKERDVIRNIALDRALEMSLTYTKYRVPEDFNAEQYYADTIGIFVNEELKPQRVVVRVFGKHVEYVRSLPLHHSQQEIKTEHGKYSDFQYRLCLTPELTTKVLSMGDGAVVLEPSELREGIINKLISTLNIYNK